MGEESWEEPVQVARLLAGFERPWYIAGGWAIDLYLGRRTRRHSDLEIAILRRDQGALRSYLKGWEFGKVLYGTEGVLEPWEKGQWLDAPIHEIHASRSEGVPSSLEILLNESSGEVWRFRRNLEVTRPLSEIGQTSGLGIPFLRPEIVLLYKAKTPRELDEEDFEAVRGLVSEEAAGWLRLSLEFCYPEHPWLSRL